MTEQLPLTIHISADLLAQFSKLNSVINKLEAQLNFHTLTANWYGDEEDILTIELYVESPESFDERKETITSTNQQDDVQVDFFSDDVLNYAKTRHSVCYIALTQSELSLLQEKPSLLADFLRIKLSKVLNLIADHYQLPTI
ncbi:hypothetical protein EPA86_17525 [Litorilituus lipolyticus]|uniref:Uncharacterized protein n=2 Tax=Litorilituus lipolyticus TaxID=2491017 RepID=A0A502KVI7_9GAMM|nr:hypothetical protein EPA86_17525 [Litorilituus lipolyticus]